MTLPYTKVDIKNTDQLIQYMRTEIETQGSKKVCGKRSKTGNGRTILHLLALADDRFLDVIKLLLKDAPKEFVNEKDIYGCTALHFAVFYKQIEITRALLEFDGIDIYSLDSNDDSPIELALESTNEELVSLFLPFIGERRERTWYYLKK